MDGPGELQALPRVNFFPDRGERTSAAKAVCAECSVRDECLAFALEHPDLTGIWGGMSGQQRRRLRAGRAA